MASHILAHLKPSTLETQGRRNRLRRILLETLERRELLAADLLTLGDMGVESGYTTRASAAEDLLFTSLLQQREMSSYDMTNFLDNQLGSSPGNGSDLTARPWFHLIEESYDRWSRENDVAFSYTSGFAMDGLVAEGEGGLIGEGEAGGPRILSVAPNSGAIFSFNDTNLLTEAPTELVFRFDGASDILQSSLAGIRVIKAGGDGVFGNGNDTVIEPGFVGFGDNNRIVVLRFASTLQDDLYRVELNGDPANGTALRNVDNLTLQTRLFDSTPDDMTRDTVDFNLELGAQILAVVPQPVDRLPNGALDPKLDVIRVFFNNDDLDPATATNPAYYQLIMTNDTIEPSDDVLSTPDFVTYDPLTDMAELHFTSGQLNTTGTFRLRIGSRESAVPATLTPVNMPDVAGHMDGAAPLPNATSTGSFSSILNQSIITTAATVLPIDFPGSNFEPGHRDIQDESHVDGTDTSPLISQQAYNFAFDRPYGVDAAGRPVNTSITPEQVARVREIFDFYSELMGVDFVETVGAGLTIVVGDLFPLGAPSGPGGVIGIAGGGLAIMDGAEDWDNSFGADFFDTAMHEIGHLLGLGHTYDLPPQTNMGAEPSLGNPNSGIGQREWVFPGDHDVVHGQRLFRPDNRDVDMYQFTLTESGHLTAETIAENLPQSSNLDTHLTLIRGVFSGGALVSYEIIASNDNSLGSDSFVATELTPGTYFIAVTGKGNEDFSPLIPNTGSGAVSQGAYQLRVDFRSSVPSTGTAPATILDTSGTSLDGNGDGKAGGNFNFWFRTTGSADSAKTVYVDKSYNGPIFDGSAARPFNNLDFNNTVPTRPAAQRWPVGFLQPNDILRVVGNIGKPGDNPNTLTDNRAYEIGRGGVGNAILSDGLTLELPRGVTMMVDAGAIFKMQGSRIAAGSLSAGINNSFSALQVLGTPALPVYFTSYRDESIGVDTNPLATTPGAGDWGGLDFQNTVDRAEGFGGYERQGIFLNYVSNADIRYGGGQVTVSSPSPTVNPINMSESRPTLLNNIVRFSADAAMAADPNSFEETRFTEARYQLAETFSPDYQRVGPAIRGNTLLNNSTNGLFIRTTTAPGGPLQTLDVAARFDDTDIVYTLGENLIISGNRGGSIIESVAPNVSLVQTVPGTDGTLTAGAVVRYKVTAIDRFGAQGVPSVATAALTLGAADSSVQLNNLPAATGDFVARRLWRSVDGGNFVLVSELDGDSTSFRDGGTTLNAVLANPNATSVSRARPSARLQLDPGVIIKSTGARIEADFGAQLLAEGTADRPVIFTSRLDDRYGAGGTFDTNSDGTGTNPGAGNWSGLISRHLGSMSIDHAIIAYAGGVSSVPGGFAGFSAVEIRQGDARITNTRFEVNASGLALGSGNRAGRGPNDASVIFVVGSQPIIMNNTFINNSFTNTAAISINANAMTAANITDSGRQTGNSGRSSVGIGNVGPLVAGNSLLRNGINGLRVRGETLTTETIWDDADIVHVLQSQVIVPDLHTFGGMTIRSKSDQSLVVKLTANAGITTLGRPLDITDRIGGSLRVLGTPGFPVVMTSINDDSVGAGFDPNGRPLLDTSNNGLVAPNRGDWRSIRLEPYTNDRNVNADVELETDQIQDTGTNDVVSAAQNLGALASSLNGGDENLRLGFSVDGAIAAPQDLDVYSFSAVAGTLVWIDIDKTSGGLDSVVELIDASSTILALSNNSLAESAGTQQRFVNPDPTKIDPSKVYSLEQNLFATPNTRQAGTDQDLYSVNPYDAGMRLVLPGSVGSTNTYFVRVRSSNLRVGDPASKLVDPAFLRAGLSAGAYRLQIRLQQADETAGTTIRYADIRYATNAIEARGMPGSSPLLGQAAELTAGTTALGNIVNSDRGSVSVAGNLFGAANVDFYTFSISRDSIQSPGDTHISTILDIDYADGFGRPDTSLWVFDASNRLVLIGTDSNIADDRAAPGSGSGLTDLTRGSAGARDPFIGAAELPAGTYTVAVTNNSQIASSLSQFQQANSASPLMRLEPINSVNRLAIERFGPGTITETFQTPQQVLFPPGADRFVPWTLGDVTTYVVRSGGTTSDLVFANALTGAREADISNFPRVNDTAMSPDGRLVGYQVPAGVQTDANAGVFQLINSIGAPGAAAIPTNAATVAGNTGILTFTTQATGADAFAIQQRDAGAGTQGDGIIFNGLTFHTSTNELMMFGVGSRGNNQQQFFLPTFDANGAVNGIGGVSTFTRNIVYKLDPVSGVAINPAGVADREGNARVNGAGTNRVEFGRFLSEGSVTGLAEMNGSLFGVSNLGEVFVVRGFGGNNAFGTREAVDTIVDPETGLAVAFSGLTRGPRNLEGGRFSNILFGTTADGTIYAFSVNAANEAVLQPVFPGLNFKVRSNSAGLGANVVGLDFSPLDVNLWHTTEQRATDPGHGRTVPYDRSQPNNVDGGRSLHFGFKDPGLGLVQPGNWNGVFNVANYYNTYDLPGGADGAVVSNPLDLRGYSADDLPMLYFNYFLDTENAASDFQEADSRMRDAFRVYASGADGNWVLLTTNNTPLDAGSDRNGDNGNIDELDNFVNGNFDAFGNPLPSQEAFDTAQWRQVRTSLGAFAGQDNVRLRFEFSTGATFNTGDPLRGGVELMAVAGSRLTDGETFTVTSVDIAPAQQATFELEMGLVLNMPSASGLTTDVSQVTIDGTAITFSLTDDTGNNVQYLASDSPAQIAAKLRTRLPAILGITPAQVNVNAERPNVLNIAGVNDASLTSIDPAVLVALPGVALGNVAVPVHQGMTVTQIRDAIRAQLAATFNNAANAANATPAQQLAAWPVHLNTIKLYKYEVLDNSSGLGLTTQRVGDFFGVQNDPFNRLDERAQNNRFEGVYIDDIIIGFAERGEMAFNATPANTTFVPNLQYAANVYNIPQIEEGLYQLTIRTAAEFGITDDAGNLVFDNPFMPGRSFDTNDRLSEQVGIQVNANAAGNIPDGAVFTLTDGISRLTFEFDVVLGTTGAGVAQGNVPIAIRPDSSNEEIALAIRNAINSPAVQAVLDISASINGETLSAPGVDAAAAGGRQVALHGSITSTFAGTLSFPANTRLTPRVWGANTTFGEDLGDSERLRPQGQILLVANTITDSSGFGIIASAGARDQSAIGGDVGNRPYPGSPINFPTANTARLAPGVVIINNIVASNSLGGISLAGDAGLDAPIQIARVINNTIFGVGGADNGILITGWASPTLLNNIFANTGTGVRVNAPATAVLGANLYQSNGVNTVGVDVGSFPELLLPGDPLFVNTTNRRFYLAAGSRAIDSSLEALQERPALTQVKNPLGLPASPMLAPTLDVTGQRRVDDPSGNSPAGLGGNVFIDRGAVDRSDFLGMNAILLKVQDNDTLGKDSDRNVTYIKVDATTGDALVDFFSILLEDVNGTGPDPATVLSQAVTLTENGQLLTEGIDYVFGYNANSRTLRLTPIAGIWRNDSVYEITLNNAPAQRVVLPRGSNLTDGQTLSVAHAEGVLTFEFDNNGAVANGNIAVPFAAGMSAYELALQVSYAINFANVGVASRLEGDGSLSLAGTGGVTTTSPAVVSSVNAITDLAGNPLFPNRPNSSTQFTIIMRDAFLDFGDSDGLNIPTVEASILAASNGNGSRHALLPVDYPLLALGQFADPDQDGQPSPGMDGDDNDGLVVFSSLPGVVQGPAGPATLSLPAPAGLHLQSFVITDTVNRPFAPLTFQFRTSGSMAGDASTVVVDLSAATTADDVATQLSAAVQAAVQSGRLTGLTAIASGSNVNLGGSAGQLVDLTNAPGVDRLAVGNVDLVIPTSIAALAEGTFTIHDGAGQSVTFEINPVAPSNRVAIVTDLTATGTPEAVAGDIVVAINGQIRARRLVLGQSVASGSTVTIFANDEDGVSFGGVFNAGSSPTTITVVSTGPGMLDAWIDWNQDGDFDDADEQILVTSTPVQAGVNTFMIQTPVGAAIGYTTARFRLSTLGGLLASGVAVGGEVEDYVIEVAAGTPPVAVPDTYTVDEDEVLNQDAAGGVLANDTDEDIVAPDMVVPGVNLFVHDEDPSTMAIEPLVNVTHGTLELRRDGSFTYTPNLDFNGVDTFVYNVTDGRLISNEPTTVTINVTPINDAPLARDDSARLNEDQEFIRPGSDFTANDLQHPRQEELPDPVVNESHQVLTLIGARIISEVVTDFGGIAAASVRFASVTGMNRRGLRVNISTQDLGAATLPTVTMVNDSLNIVLNSHATTPTTVAGLIAAIAANPAANSRVTVTLLPESVGTTVLGSTASIPQIVVPPSGGSAPTVDPVTETLRYRPEPHYNSNIGGPILIELTITDDDTAGANGPLTATSTLTLTIDPINDSPEFSSPSTISVVEDQGPVSVDFVSNSRPGPALATDEGGVSGTAISLENQQVTYRVTALNPSPTLYAQLPAITPSTDANPGRLTFELAADVNRATPFPALLVEVVAVDNGAVGNTFVAINQFNPSHTFPATPNMYDGATLRVVDSEGNTVVFELEDEINLAGVGSTDGFPHVAITYTSADTALTLSQRIAAAVSNPPAVSINQPAGAGAWTVAAFVDTQSGEIKFTGEASVTSAAPTARHLLTNVFPVLTGSETFDGATFTLTDSNGDRITFEFNDTSSPATDGIVRGNVPIDYTPAMTQNELTQAIHAAINNPPAERVFEAWDVVSTLPADSDRMELSGVSNISLSASGATIKNPLTSEALLPVFSQRVSNESAPRTFTILADAINDAPFFELGPTPVSLEDEGMLIVPGFMTNIRAGSETSLDELLETLSISYSYNNLAAFTVLPSIDLATGNLTYQTARNANRFTNTDFGVTVTVTDDSTNPGVNFYTRSFTLDVIERNDAPVFNMPNVISNAQEVMPDPILPVVIPGFVTSISPGPAGTHPAIDELTQTVSFRVNALKDSLFDPAFLPTIVNQGDGTATLTYRLADDVNLQIPFPAILVEVVAFDNGTSGNGSVIINHFDPSNVFPFAPTLYDGATLTVVDNNGNTVVFELDDANLPGVGSTDGFPHVAIPFSSTDTLDVLNQRIADSIDRPPVASINPTGGPDLPWTVNAYADAASHEIRFDGEASVAANAPAGVTILNNLFTGLAAGQSYDGATFVITDIDGDSLTFEFNDTTDTEPATPGVMPGHMPVNYTPSMTANELSQAILNAINNPPSSLADWDVIATLPAGSDRLELAQVASIQLSVSTASTINPLEANMISPVFTQRLANETAPRTFTIVPDAINDAPEFTITQPLITGIREDQGEVTIPGFIIDARPGPLSALDELAFQTITFELTANDPTAFLNGDGSQPGPNGLPRLTYNAETDAWDLTFTTAQDVNTLTEHDLGVLVTLRDDGGMRPNTGDIDFSQQTFLIAVDPINDAPTFDLPVEVVVLEDQTNTVFPGFATFSVGPDTARDETTDIYGPPRQRASFTVVGNSNPDLFDVAPTIDEDGQLHFVLAVHQNGDAIIVVQMQDDGVGPETGNGDQNQAVDEFGNPLERTFVISVTPINDPPQFDINPLVPPLSQEDQGLVQLQNFLVNMQNGPDEATDETESFVTETELLNPADASRFLQLPFISTDGTLRFETAADVNGLFMVRVRLVDEGLAGPAPHNNTSEWQTFTINVEAINDKPIFSLLQPQVDVIEDVPSAEGVGFTRIPGYAFNIQAGPSTAIDELTQPLEPTFRIVSISAPELFAVAPSIDTATGDLTFTTLPHRNGKSVIVVRLVDLGVGTPPPNANASDLATFTISVDPINDAPEYTIPAETSVIEDAGLVSINGFATNVRRGPVGSDDENSQTIRFEIRTEDVGGNLFSVLPFISVDGTLTFQTAPNINSAAVGDLRVWVRLIDSGPDEPEPNSNGSREPEQMFLIKVTPVNDDPIPNGFRVAGIEDQPLTIQASDVIADDAKGPTPDEDSQTLRMTQIERTSAQGGRIVPVFVGTGAAAFIESFIYTPPQDLVGEDTFLYVVTDDGTPNRSGTGTITVTLAGVNDPPQFTKGPNQVVVEDAETVTVPGWATNILPGPDNAFDEHATQTVTFTATTTAANLFEVQPTISSDGTLTFKPALDATGTAVVRIVAFDSYDPPAASVEEFLTITITPVNDAPVFTLGGNITVDEDSGPFAAPWATAIAPAAGLLSTPPTSTDEAGQVVDFALTVSNRSLFSVQPSISSHSLSAAGGTLQFTANENAFGTSVITVTAVDRGPVGGANINSSVTRTFTITINPVNDAPVGVPDTYATNENTVLNVPSPGVLANDTDVDLPNDTLSAVPATLESAFGAAVIINADGSFSYDPTAVNALQRLTGSQSVIDSFVYQVRDAAGALSAPVTVSINVAGVDDAPVAMDDTFSIGVGQTRLLSVLSNDTDIDSAIDARSIVITQQPIFGTAVISQTGVVEYTAGPGFRGTDTFAYTVADVGGNRSNEALVTVNVNNAPVANNDNAFTYKNEPVDINVLANDSDIDGTLDPSSVEIVIAPSTGGTATVLENGQIRFTPATGFAGQVQLSYVVSDNLGTPSNVANVSIRVQNSRWQNPSGALDVNGDGFVSPIDVLLIINYLNSGQPTFLPNANVTPPPFLDPSGDERVTPLDIILIINHLNARSAGGEGEGALTAEAESATSTTFAMMVTPAQMIDTVGAVVVREVQARLDDSFATPLSDAVSGGLTNNAGTAIAPLFTSGVDDDEEDLVHMLSCSADEFTQHSLRSAVDSFFGEIGPKRPK